MGNPASKLEGHSEVDKVAPKPAVSTPVRLLELDPRSPSSNIARTPIEQILSSKVIENIALAEENSLLETRPVSENNEFCKTIFNDPRSPTTEFVRTPIVIESKPTEEIKLKNKKLDSIRKQISNFDSIQLKGKNVKSNSTTNLSTSVERIKSGEQGRLRRPKSTAFTDKIKSSPPPGLLETNIDDVLMEPLKVQILTSSPTKIKSETHEHLVDKEIQTDLFDENNSKNIQAQEGDSKVVKAVQTEPIVDKISDKTQNDYDNEPETIKNEELFEEATQLIKYDEVEIKKMFNLISPSVEEFNKKLTDLIYEDNINDDLKLVKEVKENCRTPLGVRNFNDCPSRSKLRVSDKPTKLPSGSKIPVLREKKKNRRFSLQCENTPPKSMETAAKSKVTKWDPDNTLII